MSHSRRSCRGHRSHWRHQGCCSHRRRACHHRRCCWSCVFRSEVGGCHPSASRVGVGWVGRRFAPVSPGGWVGLGRWCDVKVGCGAKECNPVRNACMAEDSDRAARAVNAHIDPSSGSHVLRVSARPSSSVQSVHSWNKGTAAFARSVSHVDTFYSVLTVQERELRRSRGCIRSR